MCTRGGGGTQAACWIFSEAAAQKSQLDAYAPHVSEMSWHPIMSASNYLPRSLAEAALLTKDVRRACDIQ
eukprot:scaffold998_cov411-Prasinococcus_capsulatus_cf.AAC.6